MSNSICYQNFSINGPRSNYKSFVWFETYEIKISYIIKSLNSNKANGADNISVKMLKLLNSHIALIVSKQINLAFEEGVYPSCLKLVKVLPIFKSGSKTVPEN